MGILKKLFVIIIFLFPLGEIFRIDFGKGFVIKPLDIGIVILILLWLMIKISKKQKIKQTNILLPVILFALIGIFASFVNGLHLTMAEFFVSFSYLIRWLGYVGVFFVVSDFDEDFKKKIPKALIIVGSLIVGLGYLQYFFYPNLRNLFYLGWDEHMVRMFSVFLDPNFAGAFFVLFFLLLIELFLKKKTIPIGLLAILTLGAVFLSFSRSALIMLVVSSILLFVLMNKKMYIVILLGIIVLVLGASSRYFDIENVNLFRIASSEARIETAKKAIEIIQKHPIFGIGFNAYRYAKLDSALRNDELRQISHADAGVDNSFLFVIATTGIVGFAFFLCLWLRIAKSASFLAIASIVGLFVDSLFINSLFYPFVMVWIWIIVAVKASK